MFLSEVGYYRCHLVPISSRVDENLLHPEGLVLVAGFEPANAVHVPMSWEVFGLNWKGLRSLPLSYTSI